VFVFAGVGLQPDAGFFVPILLLGWLAEFGRYAPPPSAYLGQLIVG